MKYLIISRHGKDDEEGGGLDEPLCAEGRAKVTLEAEEIEKLVRGKTVAIISSMALRAQQSAGIISERLKVPFVSNPMLWTGEGGMVWPGQLEEAFEAIWETLQSRVLQPDVFILITHSGYTEAFPPFIGKHKLKIFLKGFSIPKGTFLMIDLENKEMTYFNGGQRIKFIP